MAFERNTIPSQFVVDRIEEFCDKYCRYSKDIARTQKELDRECDRCPYNLIERYLNGECAWAE